MVKYIENQGIVVGIWEAENNISNGYLRRSAKNRTNVGIDLIDNFLSKFPEVDVTWLVTGKELREQIDEKLTAATNEAAVYKREAEKFRKAADALARVNLINAQTIAELTGSEVVE